ncbi:uncharacterized protein LOC143773356 [Ranitomeya variabilis]|uniref:uncharacterized protein LOC143773356 n=1 Tax=Ranitomeya variabilis TaxID=490064 RepID=UPI00405695AE
MAAKRRKTDDDAWQFQQQLSQYDDHTLRLIYEYFWYDLLYIVENLKLDLLLMELHSQNIPNVNKYWNLKYNEKAWARSLIQDIFDGGRETMLGLWNGLYNIQNNHYYSALNAVLEELRKRGHILVEQMLLDERGHQLSPELTEIQVIHKDHLLEKAKKLLEKIPLSYTQGDENFSFCTCYTNLILVSANHFKNWSENEFIEVGVKHEQYLKKTHKILKHIKFNRIFHWCHHSRLVPHMVMVSGVPGVGKTMLMEKIVYDWVKGDLYQKFSFVFFFKFRELNRLDDVSLETLILHQYPYLEEQLENILQDPKKILFIFDGLDESTHKMDFSSCDFYFNPKQSGNSGQIVLSLLRKSLLNGCSILMTSRPTRLAYFDCNVFQRIVEIVGFFPEERWKYFEEIFPIHELAEKAFNYVKQNEALYTLGYLSFYLWIICTVLSKSFQPTSSDQPEPLLPKTVTQVFTIYVTITVSNHSLHKDDAQKILQSIGWMAEHGVMNLRTTFDDRDLDSFHVDSKSELLSSFLIKSEEPETYSFIHPIVQEFFSALVHYNDYSAEKLKRSLEEAKSYSDGRGEIFLRFLCGLSDSSTRSILTGYLDEKAAQASKDVITWLKNLIPEVENLIESKNKRRLLRIFYYVYEARNADVVLELLKFQRRLDLSDVDMSSEDCTVLAFILKACKNIEELDFFRCSLDAEGFARFAPALHNLQKLRFDMKKSSSIMGPFQIKSTSSMKRRQKTRPVRRLPEGKMCDSSHLATNRFPSRFIMAIECTAGLIHFSSSFMAVHALRADRDHRILFIKEKFSLKGPPGTDSLRTRDLLKSMEKLLFSEMRDMWEVASLEKYAQAHIVPKGLAIQKTLAGDFGDPTTLGEWDNMLNSFSLKILQFVIDKRLSNIDKTSRLIERTFEQLNTCTLTEDTHVLADNILYRLKEKEREIIDKKIRKFQRDGVPEELYMHHHSGPCLTDSFNNDTQKIDELVVIDEYNLTTEQNLEDISLVFSTYADSNSTQYTPVSTRHKLTSEASEAMIHIPDNTLEVSIYPSTPIHEDSSVHEAIQPRSIIPLHTSNRFSPLLSSEADINPGTLQNNCYPCTSQQATHRVTSTQFRSKVKQSGGPSAISSGSTPINPSLGPNDNTITRNKYRPTIPKTNTSKNTSIASKHPIKTKARPPLNQDFFRKFFLKKDKSVIADSNPNPDTYIHTTLANPSSFNPIHEQSEAFLTFDRLVTNDIRKLKRARSRFNPGNLTNAEKKAIKDLQNNNNIIIRPADKGGGIVILDRVTYHEESIRLLSDTTTYKKLISDPTLQFSHKLKSLCLKGQSLGILNKKEFSFVLNKDPSLAIFYHIPKMHKSTTCPPGRPIISGINSLTSNLSRYVDMHLQKCMQLIPAYLKDTSHILRILETVKWEPNYVLCTLDIKSLYTVTDQNMGCKIAGQYLQALDVYPNTQVTFIEECIRFILQHNYFWYENDFFLQICGTAMGTRFAPSYANLFVAKWEESHIFPSGNLRTGLVFWRRFIDDVLFIWNGPMIELDFFISNLNNNTFGLEFTPTISNTSINFLDLNIYIKNDQIFTKCFRKEVDSNSFIGMTSCHLPVWLANIPKGQYTRIRQNCTTLEDYNKDSAFLTQQFLDKGYPSVLLDQAKKDIMETPRDALLHRVKPTNQPMNIQDQIRQLPFITQFHSGHTKFRSIIHKHWSVLQGDKYQLLCLGSCSTVIPVRALHCASRGGFNILSTDQHPQDVIAVRRWLAMTIGGLQKTPVPVIVLLLSCNDLPDTSCIHLSSVIRNNQSLKTLDVSNNRLYGPYFSDLMEAIADSSIEKLCLAKNNLPDTSCIHLASVIRSNKFLKILDLSHNSLSGHHFSALIEALSRPACRIEELLLARNNLSDSSCTQLASVIRNNRSLKTLDLSGNRLYGREFGDLTEALSHPDCRIEELLLASNSLPDMSCFQLASVIRNNPSLKKLDLTLNFLSGPYFADLMDAISSPDCRIEELRLGFNNLKDRSCIWLESGIRNNRSLKILDLSDNNLYGPHFNGLMEALSRAYCRIEELRLARNYLPDTSCISLASVIRNNQSLKKLDLSGNCLYGPHFSDLMEVLSSPDCRIEELLLGNNNLPNTSCNELTSVLKNSPFMKKLDLTGNRRFGSKITDFKIPMPIRYSGTKGQSHKTSDDESSQEYHTSQGNNTEMSQMSNPEKSQMSNPEMSRMSNPEMSQMSNPEKSQMSDPEMSQMSDPEMSQMSDPAMSRMSDPEMSRMSNPEMSQMSNPEMSQMSNPEMSQMSNPEMSRMSNPEMSQMSNPEMSQMSNPEMSQMNEMIKENDISCKLCDKSQESVEVIAPTMIGSTFRLSIRSSGLFCCSESGIQFRVTQPVTLEYEVDSWSNYTEILQNLPGRYEIIGPLFNIKSNVGPNVVSAVYLPHCLCLGGFKGEKSLVKCFHYKDDNMAFETPSRIEAMYAVMENPTFSCIGIILYPLRLFKEGIIKRIPCHGMVLLFYNTIIKDDLNHMYRLHLYLLPRIRTVEKEVERDKKNTLFQRIYKPPQTETVYSMRNYRINGPQNANICPETLLFESCPPEVYSFTEITAEGEETTKINLSILSEDKDNPIWKSLVSAGEMLNLPSAMSGHFIPRPAQSVHFLIEYRADLISLIPETNRFLDDLLDLQLLNNEQYNTVLSQKTSEEQMRKVYDYIRSFSNEDKDKVYQSLKTHHYPVIKKLKNKDLED